MLSKKLALLLCLFLVIAASANAKSMIPAAEFAFLDSFHRLSFDATAEAAVGYLNDLIESPNTTDQERGFATEILRMLIDDPDSPWYGGGRVQVTPLGGNSDASSSCYMSQDAWTSRTMASQNYGTETYARTGCVSTGPARAFIRDFQCPGGTVLGGSVAISITNNQLAGNLDFHFFMLNGTWDETTLTYNNQPYVLYCGGFEYTTITPSNSGYKSIAANTVTRALCNDGCGQTDWGMLLSTSGSCSSYFTHYIDFKTKEGNGGSPAIYATMSYTTAVDLSHFEAEASGTDVVVNWNTSSESDIAGWNLSRSIDGSKYERINPEIIPPYQFEYTFVDADLPHGQRYCYKLEVLNLNGEEENYGPACVTAQPSSGKISSEDDENLIKSEFSSNTENGGAGVCGF